MCLGVSLGGQVERSRVCDSGSALVRGRSLFKVPIENWLCLTCSTAGVACPATDRLCLAESVWLHSIRLFELWTRALSEQGRLVEMKLELDVRLCQREVQLRRSNE